LSDFPRAANEYWPEEREYIGKKCVDETSKFCEEMASHVRDHIKTILTYCQTFSKQLGPLCALALY